MIEITFSNTHIGRNFLVHLLANLLTALHVALSAFRPVTDPSITKPRHQSSLAFILFSAAAVQL